MCNCKNLCECVLNDSSELDVTKPLEYLPIVEGEWIPATFIGTWGEGSAEQIIVGTEKGVKILREDGRILENCPVRLRNVPPEPVIRKLYANVYRHDTAAPVSFGSCRHNSPQAAAAIVGGPKKYHVGYVETTLVDGKITEIKFIPRSE